MLFDQKIEKSIFLNELKIKSTNIFLYLSFPLGNKDHFVEEKRHIFNIIICIGMRGLNIPFLWQN